MSTVFAGARRRLEFDQSDVPSCNQPETFSLKARLCILRKSMNMTKFENVPTDGACSFACNMFIQGHVVHGYTLKKTYST